jgi:integrase
MKQYLVALVFDPLRKPPKFGTLKGRAEGAFRLVAWAIANGKRQLASFTPVELAAATQDISKAWNKQGYALHKWQTILSEINAYGEMGLVSDWLRQVPLNALATDVEGKLEGLPPLPKKTVRDAQGHVHRSTKPLPDEFVTRLIRICLYYQNELAHHLFIHVDKFAALRQEDSISGKAKAMQRYKTFAQEYIDRRRWKDSQGAVMRTLPFEADYAFPPVGFKGLQDMVYAFQSTNQILIELATGMRLSEVSRLESDCVPKKSLKTNRPILRGRTYKLTVGYQGQKRTWPIPIEVAQAIANQVRLFQAFPADDGSEIWRSTGTTNFGASLNTVTVTHQLTRFPRLHKLDHLYEGGFNVRRFRPTLARHVVLAVTGAPRILQELFGHRNLTTTIDYILASPFIREEMQAAVDRQILGLKTSLVTQRQKAGGPGARLVRDAFDRYESEFEVPPDEKEQGRRMREYVETTLASGTGNLRMIMPGVICIRPIGAAGKCSKASEPPNAARCQTDCRFPLSSSSKS